MKTTRKTARSKLLTMSEVVVGGVRTHCPTAHADTFLQTRLVVGVPWSNAHSVGMLQVVVFVHRMSVVAVASAIWYLCGGACLKKRR